MSSGNVSSDPLPEDLEWLPIDLPIYLPITLLGSDAVGKQEDIPGLKFYAVESGWTMNLASPYGKLYALKLKAEPADGISRDYLTIVQADEAATLQKLVYFGEYPAAP